MRRDGNEILEYDFCRFREAIAYGWRDQFGTGFPCDDCERGLYKVVVILLSNDT